MDKHDLANKISQVVNLHIDTVVRDTVTENERESRADLFEKMQDYLDTINTELETTEAELVNLQGKPFDILKVQLETKHYWLSLVKSQLDDIFEGVFKKHKSN